MVLGDKVLINPLDVISSPEPDLKDYDLKNYLIKPMLPLELSNYRSNKKISL